MKKTTKLITMILLVATLLSVFSVSALAGPGSNVVQRMDCTIYYRDESGNTVAPASIFTIKLNEPETFGVGHTSPSVAGYALKNDSDSSVTYSMMDKYYPASNFAVVGTATYTVVYVKTYTHSVYYLYGVNTRPAASTAMKAGKPGTSYSIKSPEISGYGPSLPTVSGKFEAKNTSTTVYYYPYTYTVTYDALGGEGAPASQTKTYGVDLTLSTAVPTKSGYTFSGWATSHGSTVIAFQPGGKYIGNANMNLFAVWTKNGSTASATPTEPTDPNSTTYTVTYHANGGSGAPASQIKEKGVALTLSSVEPTRSGYTFSGWALTSTSTYPSYNAGGTYTKDADLDLYAIWLDGSSSGSTPSEPRTCTITYNANGGTGAPSAQTVTSGSKLTLSSVIPVRSGYTFKGWSITAYSSSASYSPGGTYTITSSMVLYAVWQTGGTFFYTVTFDANGGTGAPDPITANSGETIDIPYVEPRKKGYVFVSWTNQSSGEYFAPGDQMTVYSNTTLTAEWYVSKFDDDDPFEDDPITPATFTVSYNANGGSGAPSSQTKTEGVTLTLSSTRPTRSGYTFKGWSTSSTATTATYQPGGSYTADASAVLYAVWSKKTVTPSTYTVSYNANGGSGAPSSQTKTEGVTLTLSSVKPTRSGYTFKGWGASSTATTATYQPGGAYTKNASATLYAVWEKITFNFTVANLEVTPNECYQNETVHVSFGVSSACTEQKNGIPVEVYFGGSLIYSSSVDLSANGTVHISFDMNVGSAVGQKTLTARVNFANRASETNASDNTLSVVVNVKKYIETSSSAINLTGTYLEGMDVISSFFAENGTSADIVPSDNMSFCFEVYEISGDSETLVLSQKKDNIVVPANGSNLVYFKWTVPEGSAGKVFIIRGTMNAEGKDGEATPNNNTSFISILVGDISASQTPNTRYEENAPSSYLSNAASPETSSGLMTWNEWEYDASTSSLILRQYGVCVSNAPTIAPDVECKTAVKSGDTWAMRSGYGITVSWRPSLDTPSGYLAAKADSITEAQIASAFFPEFNYSSVNGYYRTLENVDGTFSFIENSDAVNNARLHFIPIYTANGSYVVSCTASQIWTPAGMITVTEDANTVNIDGTIYDDWAKE